MVIERAGEESPQQELKDLLCNFRRCRHPTNSHLLVKFPLDLAHPVELSLSLEGSS